MGGCVSLCTPGSGIGATFVVCVARLHIGAQGRHSHPNIAAGPLKNGRPISPTLEAHIPVDIPTISLGGKPRVAFIPDPESPAFRSPDGGGA
jgi:hypothetical protein